MARVFFGLGTNLGDRWLNLQLAVVGIAEIVTIEALSPVYETPPWGPVQAQPHFFNMCLAGQTQMPPAALLEAIKRLEWQLGRDGDEHGGPHTIDIDLLFYDDVVQAFGDQHIPHRQIEAHPFVLVPLADVAPQWTHPQRGETVADLLRTVDRTGIGRIEQPLTLENARSAVFNLTIPENCGPSD
jgi:2-amino-4-hydroxy-6-hydroxymethyldihydropteridine diphosphokinase